MASNIRSAAISAIVGNPVDPLKKPDPAAVVDVFGLIEDDLTSIETSVGSGLEPMLQVVRALVTTDVNLAADAENGDSFGGVTLVTGNRIAKAYNGESGSATNGIYVVQASGAAVRAGDADASAELIGARFEVAEGTYAGSVWSVRNTATITVGTTAVAIVQTGSASSSADAIGAGTAATLFQQGMPRVQRLDDDDRAGGVTENSDGTVEFIQHNRSIYLNLAREGLLSSTALWGFSWTGQSFMTGYRAVPPLSWRPRFPNKALMLSNGQYSPGVSTYDGEDAIGLEPSRSIQTNIGGEFFGEGANGHAMMEMLISFMSADDREIPCMVTFPTGISDKNISEVGHPSDGGTTEAYMNVVRMALTADRFAKYAYNGIPFRMGPEILNVGQSTDPEVDTAAEVVTKLNARYDRHQSTLKEVPHGGQAEAILIFLFQTSSDVDSTAVPIAAEGQRDARNAQPTHFKMIAPSYWQTNAPDQSGARDNTHPNNRSQLHAAQLAGQALWNGWVNPVTNGETSARIITGRRSGTALTLYLRKPTGAGDFYFDTLWRADVTNKGFSVSGGGLSVSSVAAPVNTPGTIPAGEASGEAYDATIVLTLSGSAGTVWRYAKSSGTTGGVGPAAWGNLFCHSGNYSPHDMDGNYAFDPDERVELSYPSEINEGTVA